MSGETLLATERLRLQSWRPGQVDDLIGLHGDAQVARYISATGAPWSEEQARKSLAIWIDEFARHRMGKLRLIRKSDGVLVGRAGFSLYPPTGEPELGFALFPQFWGQGYATEAAEALRDWLFRETAWDHCIGIVDVRNTASQAVLRRIGMQPTHVQTAVGLECQFLILRKPT